jgi:Uma2 family endonuclease
MSEHAADQMVADAFLAWHERQDARHELVDGVPVAMAGPRRRHDQVVVNALVALGRQLGVGECRPFTSDTAVRVSNTQVRYPDLGVDCGRFVDEALEADAPKLVLEVLSESTRAFDFLRKLEEYKTVSSLRHIILVDTVEPKLIHWSRPERGIWTYQTLEGLDANLEMTDPMLSLQLPELYAGLTFILRPRLVFEGGAPLPVEN